MSRWRGVSSPQEAYSRCHKGLTLFSDEPHPRVWFTFHYRNPSRRNPEPLQRSWGTHPQLNRGLPNLARSFTTRSLRDTTNRLGYTMHPRGTSSWEHNAPKSNKLLEPSIPRFTEGNSNLCTKCKRQEHKCSNPSLSNSN